MYNEKNIKRVSFQDEWKRPGQSFNTKSSKVIQGVISYSGGLIKNEKKAQYVLIGFVVFAVAISFFLLFSNDNSSVKLNIDPVTNQEIIPGQVYGQI